MISSRSWMKGTGPEDVVGARVLVGVQMVDISRLSAHPVPMINQGLVTVAGQGPTDSNGAGKSSFIAALSLLHADEQWKPASGARDAAELLFTAELAAQEGHWSNADRGYIIGVFSDPTADTVAELEAGAISVWLRVNRKAPYIDLRWCDGLHVPYGATEAERAARVDELWAALPASNGRTDFHANRLSTVLFGGYPRCVSFLSTSVRASQAANLLAQPLNELRPARIFDAIAGLTGLDHELAQEQTFRTTEHEARIKVRDTETELEAWEQEMARVESGIRQRRGARDQLTAARAAWQSRCAQYLIDAVDRAEQIRAALKNLDAQAEGQGAKVEALEKDLAELTDDEEFRRRFTEAERRWKQLSDQDRELETQTRASVQELERLSAAHRQLTEQARGADGRTVEAAEHEAEEAQQLVDDAIGDERLARAAVETAEELLQAAEAGQDLAADQLRLLDTEGIPAAPLLDVIQLNHDQRQLWEPRLIPYREAIVVPRGHADKARALLARSPGSMLVLADAPTTGQRPTDNELPDSVDPRFEMSAFVSALADRAGQEAGLVDRRAGLIVLGGFTEPLTGRAARIAAARQEFAGKSKLLRDAREELAAARTVLTRAAARMKAAHAAVEAEVLSQQIGRLREENEERSQQRERLKPTLDAANATYRRALGDSEARDEKIRNLRGEKARTEATLKSNREEKISLTEERDSLHLLDRETEWGDSPDSARRHLLALPDGQKMRTTAEWNEEACHHLAAVVHACFPERTPPEEMPAEIREILIEQRWYRAGLEARVRLVPALLRALHTHLALTEEHDNYQQKQITEQRAQRVGYLNAGRQGLTEAEQTSRAHRASLAQGIKTKLKLVAEEFNRLDQTYGGYGAGLDFPEPEPPTEPDKPWQWIAAPKWRRAEGQRMGRYDLKANTAQLDEKAAKLVCAAALAGSGDRPLLLILDELGRNLGKQHRREAVALFEQIGRDRNITVIGALQDDMERYAIEASGLYIKLRRGSDAVAYNDAPVVVGDDTNRERVALLHEWLSSYRPTGSDDELNSDEGAA